MGTTVSSLHILGAGEVEIRAALSKADQKIARFAAPGRFSSLCVGEVLFEALDRKANALSKKLVQPVLAVSMFDGDDIDLSLFQGGHRITRHLVRLETDTAFTGNAKAFCAALDLPEEMAPKLKRLLADPDQEEKLSILSALLGASLFARWDTPESFDPVPCDIQPLNHWLAQHPLPPKLKNQCRGEVVQEILDLALEHGTPSVLIFRPLAYADDPVPGRTINCGGYIYQEKSSDGRTVEGFYTSDGFWGRLLPSGRLELKALREEGLQQTLGNRRSGELDYAALDKRLVTCGQKIRGGDLSGWSPYQTVMLADTAGILPLPLPIELDGQPRVARQGGVDLLPDGGFSVALEPLFQAPAPFQPTVLAAPGVRVFFGPDGVFRGVEADRGPSYSFVDHDLTLGGVTYRYERQGHHQDEDALLRRLSDGAETLIPDTSELVISPDGTRIYAAGFRAGLAVLDAASHRVLRRVARKDGFHIPLVDRENRLWVGNGGYLECYAPDLALISRHRLSGNLLWLKLGEDGSVLGLTYQRKKFHTRLYRFEPLEPCPLR